MSRVTWLVNIDANCAADAELLEVFTGFGLVSVERSRSRRFAIGKFASADQAAKAVAAKPTLKSGYAIRVEPEDPNHVPAPRAPRAYVAVCMFISP